MMTDPDTYLPTRESLVTRLKNWEDSASWQEFFDTYWKLIYNAAVKSGLRDDEAQDVVQETLLAVSKAMPGFKYDPAIGSFKGFLLRTTRWRITDYINRVRSKDVASGHYHQDETRDRDRTATAERIPDPASLDLDSVWEKDWQQNLVDAAIERVKRRVSPKTFQLFELRVLKEWPVSKIARNFRVSMAKVHLARHRVSRLISKEVRVLKAKVA